MFIKSFVQISFFIGCSHFFQLAKGAGEQQKSLKLYLKLRQELDKQPASSDHGFDEHLNLLAKIVQDESIQEEEKIQQLLTNVNSIISESTPAITEQNQISTSTEDPARIHPLAGLLVMRYFDEFRAQLEEALRLFIESRPREKMDSRLYYELFVFSSFFPIHKMYNCTPIMKDKDCQHLLMALPNKAHDAFIIKYVMSTTLGSLQRTAEHGLRDMLKRNFDRILLRHHRHVTDVFSVCISFYKEHVGLAHFREKRTI